jgi:hypothetical protein
MDDRSRLVRRIAAERGELPAVQAAVTGLDQGVLDRLIADTKSDLEGSPILTYQPDRIDDAQVDSLWLFSWGYRIDPNAGIGPVNLTDPPPPLEALQPGPVNAAIAKTAADFVARHPVPIIAQWEIARELEKLGVRNVISVEPKKSPDGKTIYLSTPGVVAEGKRLASEANIPVGRAGVITFTDLAVGGIMASRLGGLDGAAVPASVQLPTDYDAESGQLWTRSLEAWLPVDLLGRAYLNNPAS